MRSPQQRFDLQRAFDAPEHLPQTLVGQTRLPSAGTICLRQHHPRAREARIDSDGLLQFRNRAFRRLAGVLPEQRVAAKVVRERRRVLVLPHISGELPRSFTLNASATALLISRWIAKISPRFLSKSADHN
jgi:hypothetical protein